MADKLGLLNQWMFGNWAERDTINRNAETLSNVETTVADLRKLVERQAKEITQLRAMFMGMVEVLHRKGAARRGRARERGEGCVDKAEPASGRVQAVAERSIPRHAQQRTCRRANEQ